MSMRRFLPLCLCLVLSGCSTNWTTPRPAPAVAAWPQEIQRNQTEGLVRMGMISVTTRGGPADAEEAIKKRATKEQADYYLILFINDNMIPGIRRADAILYRKA